MSDDTVTISRSEYAFLRRLLKVINRLKEYGVDTWEGYDEAMAEPSEEQPPVDNADSS